MRALLFSLSLLLSSCLSGQPGPSEPNDQRLLTRVLDSVVVVGADFEDGPGLICTGYIADNGLLVTAAHCILDGLQPVFYLRGHDDEWVDAYLLYLDREEDIAILQAPGSLPGGLPLMERDPAYGDRILCIGHPSGLRWSVTQGHVSFPKREGGGVSGAQTWVQVDCRIDPGNSGGPVVDRHGYVVGVVSFGIRHSFGAVHTSVVRDALRAVALGRN